MVKIIWLYILLLSPMLLEAQTSRISEEEVMIQKLFIEANKEKILGNYESSASLYREVLGKNARNDAAAYELARVYDVMDQDKDALQSISLAVSINPVNSWYQIFKADILEKQKDYPNAAAVYGELINYFPTENYYYYKQAFYLVLANEVSDAIRVYNRLEKNIGITGDLTKKKFNLYLGEDNEKKATQELVKLVKAYPSDIDYRLDLAQFYAETGRRDQANKEFQEVLKLDPNNGQASIMLSSNGSTSKGADNISQLKTIFSNPEVAIDLKIKELIPTIEKIAATGDQSQAAEAIALAQLLEDNHPQEAKAFAAYGDLLFYTGNIAAAKEKYNKAIQLDKSVFGIWEQLLHIAEAEKDYEQLVKISSEAQVYFPNQLKTYYFKGIGEYGMGNYDKAAAGFKRTLIMSRKDPMIQFDTNHRMILVNTKLKKWDAAKTNYDNATAIRSGHPGLMSSYALSIALQGSNSTKALELIQSAEKIAPKSLPIQRIYGQVLMLSGDTDESKKWLEKAIANKGDLDPETLESMGDLYDILGDSNQAKSYWQKAIEAGASEILLRKKIDSSQRANQ